MSTKNKKYYKNNRVFVFLLACLIANRFFIITNSQVTLFSDDAIYAQLARFFSQGNFSSALHPTWQPLYPFFTALVHLFVSSWENSLRLVSLIFFAFSAVTLYEIAKLFFKKISAIAIVLVYSLLPAVFPVSLAPMSDIASTGFILFSILFFLKFITQKKYRYLYISSFGWGLTYLTRTEGLLFFYLTTAYLFIILLFRTIKNKKVITSTKVFLVFIGIFFLTILPYSGYLSTKMGYFPLSHKATAQLKQEHAFKLKNDTTWSQEIVSVQSPNHKSSYYTGGVSYALRYSDWLIFWFKQKAVKWQHVYNQTFSTLIWIFIGLGIISVFSKKKRALMYPLYLMLTIIPVTVFGTAISDIRYLLWTLPLMLILAFSGINLLARNKQKFASAVFVVASLTSISLYPIRKPVEYASGITRSNYQPEVLAAAEYLSSLNKHPILMSRHEGLEFYNQGETIYIPQELTVDELVGYGKKHQAQFLVAWKREIFAENNYKELFSSDYKNDNLNLVYTASEILIYEIK